MFYANYLIANDSNLFLYIYELAPPARTLVVVWSVVRRLILANVFMWSFVVYPRALVHNFSINETRFFAMGCLSNYQLQSTLISVICFFRSRPLLHLRVLLILITYIPSEKTSYLKVFNRMHLLMKLLITIFSLKHKSLRNYMRTSLKRFRSLNFYSVPFKKQKNMSTRPRLMFSSEA